MRQGEETGSGEEAVVTRKYTKVPTNQGYVPDGQGTERVTWELCVLLLELGSRF